MHLFHKLIYKTLFIASIIPYLFGCASLEIDWEKARNTNNFNAYNEFLSSRPNSKYDELARVRLINLRWMEVLETRSSPAMIEIEIKQFFNYFPGSEARKNLLYILWKSTVRKGTEQTYRDFLKLVNNTYIGYIKKTNIKIAENMEKETWWVTMYNKIKELKYTDQQLRIDAKKRMEKLYREEAKRIEQLYWKETVSKNSIYEYKKYIKKYPNGQYIYGANSRIDEITWLEKVSQDTISGYEQYIKNYSSGRYLKQAKLAIEYRTARKSISLLRRFIKKNPETEYYKKAVREIEQIAINQIQDKGVGGRFIANVTLPKVSAYKGGITIMKQAGNAAYMISPLYYADEMVFSMDSLNPSTSMKPSQPFLPGSVWRFVGKDIAVGDCVFSGEGSIESPLTFMIVATLWKDTEGFVHIRGNGTVKCKDGIAKKLRDT